MPGSIRRRGKARLRETSTEIVVLIDRLRDQNTDDGVSNMLNARGYVSGTGRPFHAGIVQHIRHEYELRSRYTRLRARELLTRDEIADALKVSPDTVKIWERRGLLRRFGRLVPNREGVLV